MIKKWDVYVYSFQKWVDIEIFDKNDCMYFMINNRKVFDKFNEIWKVSNFIKKINSELVYNKKYIKRENKMNTKESLQCFYIPVMLIDSVYRKDENYYPKVFLEKHLIKI